MMDADIIRKVINPSPLDLVKKNELKVNDIYNSFKMFDAQLANFKQNAHYPKFYVTGLEATNEQVQRILKYHEEQERRVNEMSEKLDTIRHTLRELFEEIMPNGE